MKMIDLSGYNSVIDFSTLKKNIDEVIIRCAYRGYRGGTIVADSKFEQFVKGCKENNIPFGIYFMSQAINEKEAIEEADYACTLANIHGATLPVIIDSEWSNSKHDGRADGLSREDRTKITVAFCEEVKAMGCVPGVYASTSWFRTKLTVSKLMGYKIWVAQYAKQCTATHRVDAWQYTSQAMIDGMAGRVDVSEDYSMNTAPKISNPYPVPTRILKYKAFPMMHGDDVKFVQFIVGAKVDGWFGKETNEKVLYYQLSHNLKFIDGIVGKETLSEMLK